MSTSAAAGTNFIPAPRRNLRRVQAEVRRWTVICGVYASVAAVGLVGAAVAMQTDATDIERQIEHQSQRAQDQQKRVADLKSKIKAAEQELEADKAVSVQPDWSVLLALLPSVLGEEAALRRVSLLRDPPPPVEAKKTSAPAEGPEGDAEAKKPKTPPVRGFTLKMTVVTAVQSAPNTIVLSLESSGLFDRVKLAETRREPGMPGGNGAAAKPELIVCEIECRLAGGPDDQGDKKGATP